jgi:ubiquinone/menaquinone biosynthesis C-methylase UbiE
MKLRQLRRHWNHLAGADPFWAVLTDGDKRGGGWDAAEFYATGVAEVEADLKRLRDRGFPPAGSHALDFGCGAGLLTQALAAHFGSVTGVDVSERMLAVATAHNAFPDRVRYVHNTARGLRFLNDASVDFIYSRITLQHMKPELMRRYVAEFARILAPAGVMFFQIPETVPKGNPRERFRFSSWPPTLWRRVRRLAGYQLDRWFPPIGTMQMHAASPSDVASWLAHGGAVVRLVEREAHPDHSDCLYVAQRKA